jgi:hypothetical protein
MGWNTWVWFLEVNKIFLFVVGSAIYSAFDSVDGRAPIFRVVNHLGLEADHSAPSSVDVKNAWNYTSLPPYIFMPLCLANYRTSLVLSVSGIYPSKRLSTLKYLPVHVHDHFVSFHLMLYNLCKWKGVVKLRINQPQHSFLIIEFLFMGPTSRLM